MQVIESLAPTALPQSQAAVVLAQSNLTANLAALSTAQPGLAARPLPLPDDLTWLFARDGSLTAMMNGARWWAGCSVPRRAAEFMFKGMEVGGVVACFLAPQYAPQLRVALDKLDRRQAVIAVVPEPGTLSVLLHCEDFSRDIAGERLWFVSGESWEADLRTLFEQQPGLPTPSQFLRPIAADNESTDRLIAPAQAVFNEVGAARATELHAVSSAERASRSGAPRLCIVQPSRFRLWDDAGTALGELDWGAAGVDVTRIDSDRPTSSAPLALARVAAECDAVLAPNLSRGNVPGVVSDDVCWIAWVTSPRIPPAEGALPHDRLLLADPAWRRLAEQAGWDSRQVRIARWPALTRRENGTPQKFLAIVADTLSLEIPPSVAAYSSQVLLWEHLCHELSENPFLLGASVEDFLSKRRERFGISEQGFDRDIFIHGLIVPAYQQAIARVMLREKLPVRLFGTGWDAGEFEAAREGPVRSRDQLRQILHASAALVHVWPACSSHPAERASVPVVRTGPAGREGFLETARRALRGDLEPEAAPESETLTAELIAGIVAPR